MASNNAQASCRCSHNYVHKSEMPKGQFNLTCLMGQSAVEKITCLYHSINLFYKILFKKIMLRQSPQQNRLLRHIRETCCTHSGSFSTLCSTFGYNPTVCNSPIQLSSDVFIMLTMLKWQMDVTSNQLLI